MLEGHISKAFDGALSTLHVRLIEMGGLVLDQVREATHAYTEWEEEGALRVIERERDVNEYSKSIDNEQTLLIARRSPVASDLRTIISFSKCVAELERAGDEAKKIARNVLGAGSRPGPATARDARHLGDLAVSLLRLALEGLDTIDPAICQAVITKDAELDEEYAAGLRRLLSRAMEDPRQFEVALEAAFVLKSLERIGDHARNLARHILTSGAAG
ncbi:MAG TPA: phosphate signaling complex protein PhoU [Steroidobacteraceae bacterium]|nr:phosphate signaling complex protein PhoU [Steroidobacteraceae bacterium]